MKQTTKLLLAGLGTSALLLSFHLFISGGNPGDENPKRRYDPNWKVTGYFKDADTARAKADFDRLEKELGDGYTVTRYNTDKDWQCKFGGCHEPLTYIIEHPGWEDEARTEDSRQGSYIEYDPLKGWVDTTVTNYNNKRK